jgi:hypothetical protein
MNISNKLPKNSFWLLLRGAKRSDEVTSFLKAKAVLLRFFNPLAMTLLGVF